MRFMIVGVEHHHYVPQPERDQKISSIILAIGIELTEYWVTMECPRCYQAH
jgi:hypothetical protein